MASSSYLAIGGVGNTELVFSVFSLFIIACSSSGLLFLFGFRINKCSEKTKNINSDKIINNQSYIVNRRPNVKRKNITTNIF